jgi:hypothetical protein
VSTTQDFPNRSTTTAAYPVEAQEFIHIGFQNPQRTPQTNGGELSITDIPVDGEFVHL